MDREQVLTLIMSQMVFYGYSSAAAILAKNADMSLPEASNSLVELISTDKSFTPENKAPHDDSDDEDTEEGGLIIDPDSDAHAPPPDYVTWFTTQHKFEVYTAAFTPDGKFLSTGSKDNSIKILDVDKIKASFTTSREEKPVLKTIYDHTGPVNEVAFHPNGRVLASCSDDCSIKLFDIVRREAKKSFRYFQDSSPIRSISFHPSGDFLLAATDHEAIRIFDVQTLQCYTPTVSSNTAHKTRINSVRYSHNGSHFVTCSDDGTIKIWDSITGALIKTINEAHDGYPVSSVSFSKNGKYILSCGLDSFGRLWDVKTGKSVMQYEGATYRDKHMRNTFSSNEEYVFSGDERANTVATWDIRTGEHLKRFTGHSGTVLNVVSTAAGDGFISCSEDQRARIWFNKP